MVAWSVLLILCSVVPLGAREQGRPADTLPYPRVIRAEIPLYPPAAWAAHLTGNVEIEVNLRDGAVVDARVKRGTVESQVPRDRPMVSQNQEKYLPYLSVPSLTNVKTWQFEPGASTTFVVSYTYRIEGEETVVPENPRIELDLPRAVRVTVKPVKPSCSDCTGENEDGQKSERDTTSLSHEAGHAQGHQPEN